MVSSTVTETWCVVMSDMLFITLVVVISYNIDSLQHLCY